MNNLNQTFDLVGYISQIVSLKKHGAYYIGACPMCGGKDRFNIKRNGHDMWVCRNCAPDKYHSAIDFVMAYKKIDYKEAVRQMGGELEKPQRIQPAPVQVIPDSTWQAEAWKQVDRANINLIGSEAGEAGRRYLLSRGISRGSIFMHLLGFTVAYKRPCIVIPYLDLGNVISAVKYRFIDDLARTDKGRRFAMLNGSIPCLFGLLHVLPTDKTLLFVEGELNAISVLQTLPHGVSVVSAGSDSNGNASLLRALGEKYERAFVWMDDPEKAEQTRAKLGRDAKLMKSPILEGVKWDANQMLQAGILPAFLERQMNTECQGVPVEVFTEAEV